MDRNGIEITIEISIEITTDMATICPKDWLWCFMLYFLGCTAMTSTAPQSFFRQMACPGINRNYRKWSSAEGSLVLSSPIKPIFPFPIPVKQLKVKYFMIMLKILFLKILFFPSLVGIPKAML